MIVYTIGAIEDCEPKIRSGMPAYKRGRYERPDGSWYAGARVWVSEIAAERVLTAEGWMVKSRPAAVYGLKVDAEDHAELAAAVVGGECVRLEHDARLVLVARGRSAMLSSFEVATALVEFAEMHDCTFQEARHTAVELIAELCPATATDLVQVLAYAAQIDDLIEATEAAEAAEAVPEEAPPPVRTGPYRTIGGQRR